MSSSAEQRKARAEKRALNRYLKSTNTDPERFAFFRDKATEAVQGLELVSPQDDAALISRVASWMLGAYLWVDRETAALREQRRLSA
jgi:hypothetical protein